MPIKLIKSRFSDGLGGGRLYVPFVISNLLGALIYVPHRLMSDNAYLNLDLFLNSMSITACGWVGVNHPYNNPTWYICVLFLLFIIWYVINKYIENKETRALIYLAFIIIGWGIMQIGCELPLLYDINGRGYTYFFFGCLFYEYENANEINWKKCLICASLLELGILAVWLIIKVKYPVVFSWVSWVRVLFIPLIFMSTLKINSIKRCMSCFVLRTVGKISSGIYFTHQLLLYALIWYSPLMKLGLQYERKRVFSIVFIAILIVGWIWKFAIEDRVTPRIVNYFSK